MTRYILLKNARIINVAEKSLCDSDILIRQKDAQSDSEIVAVGSGISLPDTSDSMIKTLDLHGQFVCPSFTDMRCDICEPGNRNREDFESLGAAAALGGFGAVCSIPIDGIDASDQTVLDYIFENEHRTGGIKILPCVSLASSDGEINDIESLAKGGVVAFYDDGRAPLSVLKKAMEVCAKNGLLVIVHCQENALVGKGVMNEGNTSKMLGLNGISASCEEIAVAKNLLLAAETNCRLHVSHVSTARSVEMIRKAKADGVRVSCDTSVQYFALTDSDIPFYSANAKVMPPLRTEKDRVAITEAIEDGTIDCICSDHSPKTVREKPNDLEKALPGMIGLQTAFTVSLDRLVMGGHIDIFRLVELFTSSCASIIGFGYDIKIGQKAYLNVFSLEADTFFQSENSKSKSKNSPFLETGFRGCLTYTVTDGVLNTNHDISVF